MAKRSRDQVDKLLKNPRIKTIYSGLVLMFIAHEHLPQDAAELKARKQLSAAPLTDRNLNRLELSVLQFERRLAKKQGAGKDPTVGKRMQKLQRRGRP